MLEIRNLISQRGRFRLCIDSLKVRPNSINMVLGPNGGGKTTLLRSMAGLIDHRGDVLVKGKNVNGMDIKHRARIFGYLSQGIYLPETLVRDFLILGRFPYTSLISRYSRHDWEKVEGVSTMFDLGEYLYRDITTLSQGELQRVLLAKVFIQEPEVLLLDEPTTALDIGFKQLVRDQIYRYLDVKPGASIIISTHEPEIFLGRTDNIIMLKHGSVFASGRTADIYNDESIKGLFDLSAVSSTCR